MKQYEFPGMIVIGVIMILSLGARANEADTFADLDAIKSGKHTGGSANDPFGDLDASKENALPLPSSSSTTSRGLANQSGLLPSLESETQAISPRGFFREGFSFKKELMFEFSRTSASDAEADGWYSRNSVGFEVLKKFSTATSTVAAFDLQMRLVHRDNFHEVLNDAEGATRDGWFLEYHNVYWDCLLYTSPSPRDRQKSRMPSSA